MTRDGVYPSPDGRSIFDVHSAHNYGEGPSALDFGSLSANGELASAAIEPGFFEFRGPVFAWSSDSRSIWGAAQTRAEPQGWATSPLQPVRVWLDGRVDRLAAPDFKGQDLDAILWVGGDGLALAQFGSRGGSYRPPRLNAEPTLAMVDFRRARVIETLPFASLGDMPGGARDDAAYASITKAVATVMPDGRIRAVLRFRGKAWLVWTQGEPLRRLALDYDRDRFAAVALDAEGRRLLVAPRLSATGIICEHNPNCPPPTAQSGEVAALYDLASGERIWSLAGTAMHFESYPPPAISPSGDFAIVGVPSGADGWATAALVSMKDGHVVQTFRDPWNSEYRVGFGGDGRWLWARGGGELDVYDLKP